MEGRGWEVEVGRGRERKWKGEGKRICEIRQFLAAGHIFLLYESRKLRQISHIHIFSRLIRLIIRFAALFSRKGRLVLHPTLATYCEN